MACDVGAATADWRWNPAASWWHIHHAATPEPAAEHAASTADQVRFTFKYLVL